jgi:hypothetical protein
MTTQMDIRTHWTAIATYHREQLAAAEKMLATLPPAGPIAEPLLSDAEIQKQVLAFAAQDKRKTQWYWRKAVVEYDLVHNVVNILDDLHDYLISGDMQSMDEAEVLRRVGKKGSRQWQRFCIAVIEHLKKAGAFERDEDGSFDSFEDTAGGCDEVTQDAAFEVLENFPPAK